MSKALYLMGAAGLGAAAAIYLLDEKQGKKRRSKLKKQWNKTLDVAGDRWDEYSKEMRDRVPDISKEIGARAQDLGVKAQEYWKAYAPRAGEYGKEFGRKSGAYARLAGERAAEYARDGEVKWSPSARFVGAMASALAFYGAGRKGPFGMLLRTLSLGMFLRALFSPR